MGSNCCRSKDQSPKISLRKVFSRWSHRISPKSETVIIADAEEEGYVSKNKCIVDDPVFDPSANEDRNHVTMLLPDAPRIPSMKKPRNNHKRVSFQSDVEIMRTASSKSLDRFTVTVIQEEPKSRSKSFDSFFDISGLSPGAEYLNQRRTSSLEHLTVEEIQSTPSLITKLRRDTLGDALDLQAYKRPLVLPKPDEPLIEEESENERSDHSLSETEEDLSSFKLAAKLRRDTLGDALLLSSRTRQQPETPLDSSNEDLEETVKHSRLCSKLRRDTFGDALRQAVHCKACSSMEDITELEVPLPPTPEENENETECNKNNVQTTQEDKNNDEPNTDIISNSDKPNKKLTWSKMDSVSCCRTCQSLEVESPEIGLCTACSSVENIPDLTNGTLEDPQVNNNSAPLGIQKEVTDSIQKKPLNGNIRISPEKKLIFTDEDITSTLEKIRATGKIEPKEPYNLVYSSHMKGPFASSRENINKDGTGKSSSTDSLKVISIVQEDILPAENNRNEIIT